MEIDTSRFIEEDSLAHTASDPKSKGQKKLLEHAKVSNISMKDKLQFLYVMPPFITVYFQTVQILCANMTCLSLCSSLLL